MRTFGQAGLRLRWTRLPGTHLVCDCSTTADGSSLLHKHLSHQSPHRRTHHKPAVAPGPAGPPLAGRPAPDRRPAAAADWE